MRRFLIAICLLAVIGLGAFWVLTRPAPLRADVAAGHTADPDNGARVFHAGGCASCHAAPDSEDKLTLAGGEAFASPFGTFHAPNISPGAQGIGGWDLPAFARAVTRGVSPEGRHYYPAFPYTAYVHMTDTDVADLFAYMQTLPVSDTPSKPHEVGFPFNIRRGLGLWKLLYVHEDYVMAGDPDGELARGRYLVEALGHCGECHTPRGPLGGLDRSAWLTGAPNPSGKGQIPDISPGGLDWSAGDIAYYLQSGLTPDYDSVGGSMASVVQNLSQLPESDRTAIAAYLKALP
ncbi:Fructose dehydrogenase cytochrome subunit precursor [Sulfitobacter sp. THAF37]|uniref:cytochrome c n=1 Tax=Sulfitobacter sp. THAF37 TaxID=2587855 RepID=UPI001269411F|nr:cytochrome c [Sulfitobacter sp. THAF37]QFT59842.1 Fructose dehydrogenase cytochrome subunit precursor [Sulfitobacter sp. THAF37]